MTDGERLRQLLAESNKTQTELADACGVSRQMIPKYLASKVLKPGAFDRVRTGLDKLGIDATRLRQHSAASARGGAFHGERSLEDLRPLLAGMTRRQLENLQKILDADHDSRGALRLVIADRIERDQ